MTLSIVSDWENLDVGSAEERACFAAIGIYSDDLSLTQAEDKFVKRIRTEVHLSAYRLAEWLAWNWWRLRWEPCNSAPDWAMAHHMTTIGGGFVWPNITISSDGERVLLLTRPTRSTPQEPLRYLADQAVVVRAADYEKAVDRFIEQVQGQLRAEGIAETNLDRIWTDLATERRDRAVSERRRLEALLGSEPDEGDPALLRTLLDDTENLGEPAIHEIAATSAGRGSVPTSVEFEEMANAHGFEARPRDAARLKQGQRLPPVGEVPAWRRGVEAAQALRNQERLGQEPVSNKRLAAVCAVSTSALTELTARNSLSFALDGKEGQGRIVLRSKWETGRRFDLARLLADRLFGGSSGRLFPATTAPTYRQKFQRAFAAEFLCPFAAIDAAMEGDYSDDRQQDVADLFKVSPLTVCTLLVNHGRIERDELRDYEALQIG